jgi:hypothetical protein
VIVTADPSNDGWLSAHGIVPVKSVHLMADEVWLANCRFTSHREREICYTGPAGAAIGQTKFSVGTADHVQAPTLAGMCESASTE